MSEAKENEGLVVLVGAGPGDPDLVTRAALHYIIHCDVLIYDRLAPGELLQLAPETAERIYVGKRPGDHAMTQERINELLVAKGSEGKLVVRLKGGDPMIFGRGGEELEALAAADVAFRVVPGISAALAAGALAGIPLTHRTCASSLTLVTGHEDPDKDASTIDYAALARLDTVVFYMGVGRMEAICGRLIEAGKDASTPAGVVRNVSLPGQRTLVATLGDLPARAAEAGIEPPALIIVGPVVEYARRFNWLESLPLAGQVVLVTRTRTQASMLSEQLRELGAEVIEAPAIRIERVADLAELDAAVDALDEIDWIAFTSPNGVEAFLSRCEELGMDGRALANVRIAAVGPGTAMALDERFLRPDLVPSTYTTEALGQALVRGELQEGERVLLPRADRATPVLPRMLRQAGADVREVVAYRTVRPEGLPERALRALQAGRVDWITFCSSSTVDNFLALLDALGEARPDLGGVKIAAIGPVTAGSLHRLGLEPTLVAEEHTIDGLVDAILEHVC